MGSGIELIRITIYVFFPVALFYYFNRPDFYRKTVQEKKKILYPEGNHPPLSIKENNLLRLKLKEQRKEEKEAMAARQSKQEATVRHNHRT